MNDPDLCSMLYASVDQAAQIISQLGRDTLMAKIDIANAYTNVSVHPNDRWMQWEDSVYGSLQSLDLNGGMERCNHSLSKNRVKRSQY